MAYDCESKWDTFQCDIFMILRNVHCRRLLLFILFFLQFFILFHFCCSLWKYDKNPCSMPVCKLSHLENYSQFNAVFFSFFLATLVRIFPRLSEAIKMTFLHFMHTCLCGCYFCLHIVAHSTTPVRHH